jgi:hypothetical protein
MLPLTTAFLAAALALGGNIIFGLWGRYRDRCGVAAALAGEIGAYVKQLNPPDTVTAYRKLATFDHETRRRRLRSMLKTPDSHPVFDKIADKIGLLPAAEALEVSSIYNVVTGMRIIISSLSGDEIAAADDEVQIAILGKLADAIEQNYLPAQELIERLKRISNQSFWCFLYSLFVDRHA